MTTSRTPFKGNLEKRIKRHILGKERSFFVSTLPGLEHVCRDELTALFTMKDVPSVKGGLTFQGRVHTCYIANLELRTANRILMRIETFKATNFRQLEKKLEKVPWELYVSIFNKCDIMVTAHHSRLYHTEAVKERVQKVLKERLSETDGTWTGEQKEVIFPQKLYIRAVGDLFTVSIDSSGDLLHKRGLKTEVGKAPIRESIAAAVLKLAGYTGGGILLDPMCGAGTFSLEGALMANRVPAGWFRTFAFTGWPCFRPARWEYIRREAQQSMIKIKDPVIFASDKDPRICRNLKNVVQDSGLSNTVSVMEQDFFDLRPCSQYGSAANGQGNLVVINPPYGRRLANKHQAVKLFKEICQKVKSDFRGWKIALIVPTKNLLHAVPFRFTSHDFFHGGLHLRLVIGKIS